MFQLFPMDKIKSIPIFFSCLRSLTWIYVTTEKKRWLQFPIHADFKSIIKHNTFLFTDNIKKLNQYVTKTSCIPTLPTICKNKDMPHIKYSLL